MFHVYFYSWSMKLASSGFNLKDIYKSTYLICGACKFRFPWKKKKWSISKVESTSSHINCSIMLVFGFFCKIKYEGSFIFSTLVSAKKLKYSVLVQLQHHVRKSDTEREWEFSECFSRSFFCICTIDYYNIINCCMFLTTILQQTCF